MKVDTGLQVEEQTRRQSTEGMWQTSAYGDCWKSSNSHFFVTNFKLTLVIDFYTTSKTLINFEITESLHNGLKIFF